MDEGNRLNTLFSDVGKFAIDIQKASYINPIQNITMEHQRKMEAINKQMSEVQRERELKENERIDREKKSLELQQEQVDVQKLMLFFMQSINKDNKKIVDSLQSLISVVDIGFKVEESYLAAINEELKQISENSENIMDTFVATAKQKLVDKSVEYTLMFILQGLKQLFLGQMTNI